MHSLPIRVLRCVGRKGIEVERTHLVAIGTQVEVRNCYLGTWNGGFEVVGVHDSGYSLRRQCDDTILVFRTATPAHETA